MFILSRLNLIFQQTELGIGISKKSVKDIDTLNCKYIYIALMDENQSLNLEIIVLEFF